uniref:Retrovirus-related Pol polyprotein from transposon TNT 1-94 n=1 Tax=Cajanus cajan TaxID=3821 RepID=A0A151R861_CAJCA|nr:Retrovirus-related Pol polyprotein from transposon TNT 1-94 [Cajanus cajan]
MMEAHTKMISLNGANYHLWKGKMNDLLFVKNLHLPIFASNKLESKPDEEWDFEHQQVYGFIRQFVDDNFYNFIAIETHARTLWDKLESLHASKLGNNKLYLVKNFVELKYKKGTLIKNHLSEFQGCFDQLSGVDIKFDEDLLGLFLLNFLPNSWETFQVSMIGVAPIGDSFLQIAKSGVLNEEMRRKI